MDLKDGAGQPAGFEDQIAESAGAIKNVLRPAGNDLVVAVVLGDLDLTQQDFRNAFQTARVKRVAPFPSQWFQRVGLGFREVRAIAAEAKAKLFPVQIALAFGARIDA